MRLKLEVTALCLLFTAYIAATALLFHPRVSFPVVFSVFLFVVLSIQAFNKPGLSFTLTGFSTLLAFFALSRGGSGVYIPIASQVLTLWGGAFLLHLHQERTRRRSAEARKRSDSIAHERSLLQNEIGFYERRKSDLTMRSEKRRQLVAAAHALGACLDPADIQNQLIESAERLFPGRRVCMSVGSNPDPIDEYVLHKKQPLLIPTKTIKGFPLVAVPVKAQGAVVGILRVGGEPGPEFSPDDTRVLDILGSLSSLALENSTLFQQTQESAMRDGLTGLWTHRAFQDHLEQAILEASRYSTELSIVLTDVDHFKSVNDTYGHQAGDRILQGFAQVLLSHVRDVDIVARYGGEEFILLFLQTPHHEARRIAEAIRMDLERQRYDAGGAEIGITGSFGVASFPNEATSAQQLIRLSDERLYAAKKAGRNRVMGKAA